MTVKNARDWGLRFTAVLCGVLLLCAVEGLLRLVWSPPPLPGEQLAAVAIDPFEVRAGQAQTKPAYLGAMRPSSFDVPKPKDVFRVFCIGGSTTLGYPYAADRAWPASLERRLRELLPQRTIEVINVGATAYGSGRTLAVLRGLLKYQPDLVIAATGDAEFVEDSFRVAVVEPAPVVTWLHRLHIARALKSVLPRPELRKMTVDAEDRSAAGFLFAPVIAGTVYQVDGERRQAVMTTLRQNLTEMARVAKQADLSLILATLPANLAGWPPDPDRRVPEDPELRRRWQPLRAQAERQLHTGDRQAALENYAAAVMLWAGNAEVCYDYGQLLLAAGQVDVARAMLQQALDLDPTPVRATSAVNRTIREVATEAQVLLADPVRALDAASLHGLPGDDFILDYAHPTPLGHVEIAREMVRALSQLGPDWVYDPSEEERLHRTEREAAASPPQVNADLSFALGQVFERKKMSAKAVALYRQALSEGYQGPFAAGGLARVLAQQGHYSEALDTVLPLVEQYPGWTEGYGLLGYLYQALGQVEAAINWYRRALAAGDPDPRLFGTLATLQFSSGQIESAGHTVAQGLARHPGQCDLLALKGRTLEQAEGAALSVESFYREALQAEATCQPLWEGLGLMLMQQQRWPEAEAVFSTALQQPEPLANHHLNLGHVYWQGLNAKRLAAEQFELFLNLKPDQAGLVPEEFR